MPKRWTFKKTKYKPAYPAPRPPEPYTARDAMRDAYRSAGALDLLPAIRHTPTNLQRVLSAMHLSGRLADYASERERQEMYAQLSGLAVGSLAGTLPERLLGAWLNANGYKYGGEGMTADLTADWSFQVPLEGGRSILGGGAVADFFLSPAMSGTDYGVVVREQGQYWHTRPDVQVRDEAQRRRLELAGYKVADVWDYEAEEDGRRDEVMRGIIAGIYP